MDEQESISRREAAGGLSVLGVLMFALIGTIVFRIVQAAPRHSAIPAEPTWASNAPAAPLPAPSPAEHEPVGEALPIVSRIPVAAGGAGETPATSMSDAPVAEEREPSHVDQRPRFVAPTGR